MPGIAQQWLGPDTDRANAVAEPFAGNSSVQDRLANKLNAIFAVLSEFSNRQVQLEDAVRGLQQHNGLEMLPVFASLPFRKLSGISDSEYEPDVKADVMQASTASGSPLLGRQEVDQGEVVQMPIPKNHTMFIQSPPGFKEEEEEPPWGGVESGEKPWQGNQAAMEQTVGGQQALRSGLWKAGRRHGGYRSGKANVSPDVAWRGSPEEVLDKFQGDWIDASNVNVRYQIQGNTCYKIRNNSWNESFTLTVDDESEYVWWGTKKQIWLDPTEIHNKVVWYETKHGGEHVPRWTWNRAPYQAETSKRGQSKVWAKW